MFNRTVGYTFDPEPEDPWSWIRNATDICEYIIFAFSFPTVMANIFVLWASKRLYAKTFEPTHLLITSMAAADTLICIMHMLRIVSKHFIRYTLLALLATEMTFTWISYAASGISLCLLNLEKIIYFYWPLHYTSLITTTNTRCTIVFSWLLCMGYAIVMLSSATFGCGPDHCVVPYHVLYNFYIILFCIVPVLSSGALSLCLWFTVRAKRQQANCNFTTLRQHLKTSGFIFITTAWVVVSLVPARIHYMFFLEDNMNEIAIYFGLVANFLLSLSPMINPIITILVHACYRKWTKQCVQFMKRKSSLVPRRIIMSTYV